MHANAQTFLDQLPTPATAFAGVARINQYETMASLCRFARRDQYELIPRCIGNAFRQAVILAHPCDVHVLKGQNAETINQFSAFLVSAIVSPVRYPFVDTADDLPALLSDSSTALHLHTAQCRAVEW